MRCLGMSYDAKQDWSERHLTERGWFAGAQSNGRGHVTTASIPVGVTTVRIERRYATGEIVARDIDAAAAERCLAKHGPVSFSTPTR